MVVYFDLTNYLISEHPPALKQGSTAPLLNVALGNCWECDRPNYIGVDTLPALFLFSYLVLAMLAFVNKCVGKSAPDVSLLSIICHFSYCVEWNPYSQPN